MKKNPALFSAEGQKAVGKLAMDEGSKEDKKDQRRKKAASKGSI